MNIDGLEELKLTDLKDLFALNSMSLKEGLPLAREFRDRYGFTDKETQKAFLISNRIFGDRD